jgi:hypothetical protein
MKRERRTGTLIKQALRDEEFRLDHTDDREKIVRLECIRAALTHGLELEDGDTEALIHVIDEHLLPPHAGRQFGWSNDSIQRGRLRVAYLRQIGKKTYCEARAIDRIRMPRSVRPQHNVPDQLLRLAIRLVVQNEPTLRGQIDLVEMRSFRTQPTQSVADWVNDNMPAAVRHMRDLARQLAGAVV